VFDSGSIDLLDRISYSRRHQPSRSHGELQGLALDGETRLGVYFFLFPWVNIFRHGVRRVEHGFSFCIDIPGLLGWLIVNILRHFGLERFCLDWIAYLGT